MAEVKKSQYSPEKSGNEHLKKKKWTMIELQEALKGRAQQCHINKAFVK